jgi:hypothetical protein
MPNSPLEGSFSKKDRKFQPKWVIALLALVGFGIGGGVLAATININTSNTVEFGQGVATTATCDTSIDITPVTEFDSTYFKLTKVVLSDIDANSAACGGNSLIVKALNSGNSAIATASTSVSATAATVSATLLPDASPSAASVSKFTIESN